MRVALDANRLTDLFRGDQVLAQILGQCEDVFVPLPVLAETKAGYMGGTRQAENEQALRAFFSKESARLLLPTRETSDYFARLIDQLRAAGTPIPTNDVWIAALVAEHDLILITRDEHFRRLPQLALQFP